MKRCTRLWLLVLMVCLSVALTSVAYGAVDAAEGFDVHQVGEFHDVTIVYGDNEGRGIAVGVNYTLTDSAVAITEKPADSQAEVYFTSSGLSDFNGTGVATMKAYCDKPGDVNATILLTFTDHATKDVKFVTGEVQLTFFDGATIPPQTIETTIFTVGSDSVICDGQVYPINQAPFIENGRLYVPLRTVGLIFDMSVVYNEESGYIRLTAKDDGTELVFAVDSTAITQSDGTVVQMDVPVMLKNDSAMLPIRYLSQILNCTIALTTDEVQNIRQVIIHHGQ